MSRNQRSRDGVAADGPGSRTGWLIALAAAGLAAYASSLLYEGFGADGYAGALTFPFVDKPAAQRAYDALAPTAAPAERAQAAERLVEADPANPNSWMAVAYADRQAHAEMTPAGAAALDHSYAMTFFDKPNAVWRVSFALESWDRIAQQTRSDALLEAKLALDDPGVSARMRHALGAVRNPAGHLAAALLLASAPKAPAA